MGNPLGRRWSALRRPKAPSALESLSLPCTRMVSMNHFTQRRDGTTKDQLIELHHCAPLVEAHDDDAGHLLSPANFRILSLRFPVMRRLMLCATAVAFCVRSERRLSPLPYPHSPQPQRRCYEVPRHETSRPH